MNRKVNWYRTAVIASAIGSTIALAMRPASVGRSELSAILLLSALAVVAELLAVVLPNSARGSIAFIPYLAAALVVPSWPTVVAVAAVKALADAIRRCKIEMALLNVALHTLTVSSAIFVYTVLGGSGLLAGTSSSLLSATLRWGFPALAAVAISFVVNTTIACWYLAFAEQKSLTRMWRQLVLPTLGIDLLAGPIVFIFAWLYAAHGAIAAAALWVPLLGLREVHKVNVELQRTNEELLQLMIKSIEARDQYTSGHSRRVQRYSTLIARGLGLSERDIELVSKAALLHDVGKIHEKYAAILRKADKLSPEEWATMQEHPIDGANLVSTMSGLKDLVGPIRHHHENWDGTGYPDGLRGEAIPLSSRIITLADTIDAMTSERPYRQPLTEAQVRAEIIRCRGRQFDPTIADQLIAAPIWHTLFPTPKPGIVPAPTLTLLGGRRAIRGSA